MKKYIELFAILAVGWMMTACGRPATEIISLAGEWKFRLDPEDVGKRELWYAQALPDVICLPGSLQEQAYGFEVDLQTQWTGQVVDSAWYNAPQYAKYREAGKAKVPFWLNPDRHYVGAAWYQREIVIPSGWRNKSVWLELERPHWETTLFVDGIESASLNSLSVPHRYELKDIAPGRHVITLRVDNRVHIPVGINAHSVSDHTQSNWNGIVGKLLLTARPKAHLDELQIFPNAEEKSVEIRLSILGESGPNAQLRLLAETMNGEALGAEAIIELQPSQRQLIANLKLPDSLKLWSEHQPNCYRIKTSLTAEDGIHTRYTTFGFRTLSKEGTRFLLNKQPIFMRGTLECCIFPLTGYPATDKAYWRKICGTAKNFGLNHIRFHSWCPPEAAFEMADSIGIYLQVECAAWATVGNGSALDQWIYAEGDRILKEYGNHPSFCMMVYGNEPGGRNQVAYLSELVDYWKQKDNRRLYASAAGWPYTPNSDYWNAPDPRIQAWGSELKSIINAQPPSTDFDWRDRIRKDMPTISHEIGQWCVYPNFEEIGKYTGVMKAKNFEIFQETLAEAGLADMSERFLYASGKLQTLCYKADIEAAMRTPGFAGFQLLDLHDFPGQGTALVGVLDPFWDTKGYVTAEEYSRFCNETVPLVRFPKLVWLNNETLKAPIEIAHFGEQALHQKRIACTIADVDGTVYLSKTFEKEQIPLDNCIEVGEIELPLAAITRPAQLKVTVAVEGTSFRNQWNIWVYPVQKTEVKAPIFIADKWDKQIAERLNRGESVLLATPRASVLPERGGDIAVGFSSIFWNTAWTRGQAPHTLGICCDPAHPALAAFPNEGFSDYQWWDLLTQCDAMDLRDFPKDFRPTIYIIDDWFSNRRLGLLFEAKVGKGKLMVCSANLHDNLSHRPAAAQFKQSLLEYIASDRFNPQQEVDATTVSKLFAS
jgi:hypothetical protein